MESTNVIFRRVHKI